ncbi:MAG: DUF3108 domain-containing protein [Gammaproteobacteria bacterium]|nr:DUF3108 domain-containing protein [Gammaproteobacteria bacterium]
MSRTYQTYFFTKIINIKLITQLIVITVLLLKQTIVLAGEDGIISIPSFKATYSASMASVSVGEASVSYQYNPQTQDYYYQREAWPTGLAALFIATRIKETSSGSIIDNRARPVEYHYERSNKPDKNRSIHFDYQATAIKVTDSKIDQPISVDSGTTDSLVMTLNMMFDLEAGDRELSYTFIKRGKIKTYTFNVEGKEQIKTQNHTYETVRVRRIRENSKRSTTLWCAPELHYLPVKIEERSEDGGIERFLLKTVSIEGS